MPIFFINIPIKLSIKFLESSDKEKFIINIYDFEFYST